jgi:hypothetical protein
MKRGTAVGLILAAALLVVAGVYMRASTTPVETAPLTFPKNVGSILVLTDHLPGKEPFVRTRAEQVAIGLRYLSANTSWTFLDAVPAGTVRSASIVVYLGINGLKWLAPEELAKLRLARRLIVSQHHLDELRETDIAFKDVGGGTSAEMPAGTTVVYRGMTAPMQPGEYLGLAVHAPARTLAEYVLPGGSHVPYIVVDGNAMFVNAPLSFIMRDDPHGEMVAASDAIATFLGVTPNAKPLAMLRLEDVSAITPASRLAIIVTYLSLAHVPYGIGVIPDLRVTHGAGGLLGSNPALVAVLKWAQQHGATIILHGLHHCCSSQDAEGYEFWDHDRNAPVAQDSPAWMRAQIVEGVNDETALGLRPLMWETPHYSASPNDYAVVSQFFKTAWELRRPTGWLPWPLQRDQYGARILPENLGYVPLDGTRTVNDQLARARVMLACRYCVAVGFLHPALIGVNTVRAYVQGLRAMGYAFVDPQPLAQMR